MKRSRKPEQFIPPPAYPGGTAALKAFVSSEMKYPEEAMKHHIGGSVRVKFDVDMNGRVIMAKVEHSIGYGCDEEAVRVVKLLKFEKTKARGVRVTHHQHINIHFNLPPPPPAVPYTYSYKPANSETEVYTSSIKTNNTTSES